MSDHERTRTRHWIVGCPDDGWRSDENEGCTFPTITEAAQARGEYQQMDRAEGGSCEFEVWEVTVTTEVTRDVQPVTT